MDKLIRILLETVVSVDIRKKLEGGETFKTVFSFLFFLFYRRTTVTFHLVLQIEIKDRNV